MTTRPEYYCLTQRYNGKKIPIPNALKNPTDKSQSFDAFYGPYYGDDGIRPQLTELSNKKFGEAFKDLKNLTEFFQEHWGQDAEIRIFDATRGEIIIHGGSSERESGSELTKPELNRLPRINLNSAHQTPEINLDSLDSYNIAFADDIESTTQAINPAFNRVPRINFKSLIKPVEPSKWHAQHDGRVAEFYDMHGMFGTKFATSRRLAEMAAATGAAQTKPITPEQRKEKWF